MFEELDIIRDAEPYAVTDLDTGDVKWFYQEYLAKKFEAYLRLELRHAARLDEVR